MSRRLKINIKYKSFENVVVLVMILSFFAILAPLAYSNLPTSSVEPNSVVTGLATENIVDNNITTTIIVFLIALFLIPVELMLRKRDLKKEKKPRKRT